MVWMNDEDRADNDEFLRSISGMLSSLTSSLGGGEGTFGDSPEMGGKSKNGARQGGKGDAAHKNAAPRQRKSGSGTKSNAPASKLSKRVFVDDEEDSFSGFDEHVLSDTVSPKKKGRGSAFKADNKLFEDETDMRNSFAMSLKTDISNAISQDRSRRKQVVQAAAKAINKIIEGEKTWIEAECMKLQDLNAEYQALQQELLDLQDQAAKLERIQREYDNAADTLVSSPANEMSFFDCENFLDLEQELAKIEAKRTATTEAYCNKLREMEAATVGHLKQINRTAQEKARNHASLKLQVEGDLEKKAKLAELLIRKVESILPPQTS